MKINLSLSSILLSALLLSACGGGSGSDNDNNSSQLTITSSDTKIVVEGDTTVITLQTSANDIVKYTKVGGADVALFEIDQESGVLTFKAEPDFENPADTNTDNVYTVIVQAEDSAGNTATQTITVTVANDSVDDGPEFTSPSSVPLLYENEQLDFTVAANGAVKYTLGGEDEKRFELNSTTGKLRFLNFLPDYERSSDADHDNIYKIAIFASDDNNYTSRQTLTVTVTNDTSDDSADANRVTIYKTGAADGIAAGETFGKERVFSAEMIDGDRVIHVGNRIWQDASENAIASYSFDEADNYCSSLNYAGSDQWRVPNRHELYEIVNYGKANSNEPSIDDVFQNTLKANYWSSENVLGQNGQPIFTNEAFGVYFSDGASYTLDKAGKFAVRCVSGESLVYDEIIVKDANGIYNDPKTGFMWAQAEGTTQTMAAAKAECESFVFGGYDDWRLPNISEAHTAMPTVIEGSFHPYGAKPLFSDGNPTQMWSATPLNATQGRYLDAYWNLAEWGEDGSLGGRDVQNDANIELNNPNSVFSMCVRGGHF